MATVVSLWTGSGEPTGWAGPAHYLVQLLHTNSDAQGDPSVYGRLFKKLFVMLRLLYGYTVHYPGPEETPWATAQRDYEAARRRPARVRFRVVVAMCTGVVHRCHCHTPHGTVKPIPVSAPVTASEPSGSVNYAPRSRLPDHFQPNHTSARHLGSLRIPPGGCDLCESWGS